MGTGHRVSRAGAQSRVTAGYRDAAESATVIILPVIRIERYTDEPAEGAASRSQRRRRRRRASRSKANA